MTTQHMNKTSAQNPMHKTAQNAHTTPAQQPLLSRREQGVVHGAVCSPVQCAPPASEIQRERVRATLAKIDPTMLALADLCRERFGTDTRFVGVQAEQEGEQRILGRVSMFTAEEARTAGDWPTWEDGQR